MTSLKSVSRLLPHIFDVDPPRVRGDDPIILTGSLLRYSELHMLEGEDVDPPPMESPGVTLRPAFGSRELLRRVAGSEPSEYYKALWAKSMEVPVWVSSTGYDSPFDDVIQGFKATGFGGGFVSRGSQRALITLEQAVSLVAAGELSAQSSVEDVSSSPTSIEEDATIVEAIGGMLSQNVRRLFVRGKGGKYVSDRGITEHMFKPERLEVARDRPESWLDGGISAVPMKSPVRCQVEDLDAAAKLIGPAPDDCLVTEQGRVVTRWDIVVKPWAAGKLLGASS